MKAIAATGKGPEAAGAEHRVLDQVEGRVGRQQSARRTRQSVILSPCEGSGANAKNAGKIARCIRHCRSLAQDPSQGLRMTWIDGTKAAARPRLA